MSRIISFENVKNNSNSNNSKKYSNSSICKNTNTNNCKISNPLESSTEENKRKRVKQKKSISKTNINNIINDLNSDYFSKTNEENEQNEENISNYSAKNRRPFKKKNLLSEKLILKLMIVGRELQNFRMTKKIILKILMKLRRNKKKKI